MGRHSTLTGAELHEPKGVASAAAMRAYISNGLGSGSWERYKPDSEVPVHAASDFPAPVGGVITLADDTEYKLGADVNIGTDRIVMGHHTVVSAIRPGAATLTYTGTGVMFTGQDLAPITLRDFSAVCTAGTLFGWNGTTADDFDNVMQLEGFRATCNHVGTVTDLKLLNSHNVQINATLTGLVLAGASNPLLLMSQTAIILGAGGAGTCVDITAVVMQALLFDSVQLLSPAGTSLASTGKANIQASAVARVSNSQFIAAVPVAAPLTNSSTRWIFSNVLNVNDTAISGETSLTTPAVGIVNPGAGVYAPIATGGAVWTPGVLVWMTGDATGGLTNDGDQPLEFLAVATATVHKAGGGADQLAIKFAIDGTVVTTAPAVTQNANPSSLTAVARITVNPGSRVDLRIADLTSGTPALNVDYSTIVLTRIP